MQTAKTANQIKSSFELLASGHYQIHSFLYAQEFEQQAYENLIYPLMLVYPLGGSLSGTTYSRNYRVIIADRVLKSEGNELEVESDTQLIALDVLAYWMKLGQNERFTITSSNTITPFWEKWGDEVTGHFVDIGIEEFYDFNSCAIPLSGSIPTPVNPCKDARISVNSVVYGNAPSDSNFNVVVKDQLGSLVGSLIGGEWIVNTGGSCADATYTIEDTLGNILYTGSIVSGGNLTQAIGNSTLNVNNSAGTLISSESILAEGTDFYNVADSVAVIKDSAGTTLKSENILATASENITINDSVAVIKDSANLTLKSENILAEATENIVINDSLVNVRKSDNVLISAVSVKAENTENYLVADSLIENDATTPTYSQLVKATEGLILPTQEIQNNGVASGFIPSVGTINITTNVVPTSFNISGRTIEIVVPSGGGSYDIDTTDRFGNVLPTIIVSGNTTLNWNSYDYADLFLSREASWGGSTIENALIDLVDNLIAAGLWNKIINLHPHIGTTADNHKWNLKYPFNNRSSFAEIYNGTTHDADGVYLSTGDTKTNFMNPLLNADVNSFTYGFFQTSDFDNNSATTNNTAMDNTLSSRGCQLAIRPSDGRIVWGINENAALGTYTPASQPTYIGRHTAMSRTAASGAGSQNLYIDGVSVATRTSASIQFGTGLLYGTELWCKVGIAIQVSGMAVLLAKMGSEYSASGLNSTEMGDLHTALSTFESIVR